MLQYIELNTPHRRLGPRAGAAELSCLGMSGLSASSFAVPVNMTLPLARNTLRLQTDNSALMSLSTMMVAAPASLISRADRLGNMPLQ